MQVDVETEYTLKFHKLYKYDALSIHGYCNWASVSEPHTCDFNATFSLYNFYM